MTRPPLAVNADAGPGLGTSLLKLVDVVGVEHLGYRTARRTLCLERLVTECSPTRPANSTCPTCTHVREQMKRAHSNESEAAHASGAAARVRVALAAVVGLVLGRTTFSTR